VPALVLYLAAAATYIALGVANPDFILSWPEGAAFLLLAVWIVPLLARRLRRRS
jgi:membrane protein implicated in regulation of membrane protease activity